MLGQRKNVKRVIKELLIGFSVEEKRQHKEEEWHRLRVI
jgi:hypothetical protein